MAILIPIAISVCRETNIAPSKLLIPISFAALLGGASTLIGTSTNILVSSIAEKSGHESFGMFEFTAPALVLLGIGFVYMFTIGPFLLPKRKDNKEGALRFIEEYIAEVSLLKEGKDVANPIQKSSIVRDFNAQIISIARDGVRLPNFNGDTLLLAGDILKISISPDRLSELQAKNDYRVHGDKEVQSEEKEDEELEEEKKDTLNPNHLFEAVIPVDSILAGYSVHEIHFRRIYGCSVIAVRHRNQVIQDNISNLILKEGDMLIIYGTEEQVNELVRNKVVVLLGVHLDNKVNYKKAIPALLIAILVVTSAALHLTSILISSMIGGLLMVITTILKPQEAYEAIEWKVIFMLAGVLSMGTALEKTGGAKLVSEFIYENLGHYDPRITLSAIFLITFLSTNILSSKATAALMAPIVISLAAAMKISEKPLLIAVMFACSLTFMTPVSAPSNTMVYSPGNYKYTDYLKIGTPLNLLVWIAASFIIPYFFPF